MIFKIYYSSTIIPKLDFNVILRQYKDFIKAAISSTDTIQSIEKLKIKLLNEKSPVPLQTISAINIIDPQKIELSIFDPSFTKYITSAIQSSNPNVSVEIIGSSKIILCIPRITAANSSSIVDQIKSKTEAFKNNARELRRNEINNFRAFTKDKDQIRNHENETQKDFEKFIKDVDSAYKAIISEANKKK